jgi:hypothetical protein
LQLGQLLNKDQLVLKSRLADVDLAMVESKPNHWQTGQDMIQICNQLHWGLLVGHFVFVPRRSTIVAWQNLSHDSVLAEGSRSRVADQSSSADLECRTTEVKNVDVDTESLASLESMEVDVDLNEGIKDEDLKVEALG